ncbi:MAG: DUF2127 domain-containing protein [Nitrospirota bacterium]
MLFRDHSKDGIRVVSIFEATKGLLVLLVGCGLLTFIHQDLHLAAEQLVRHIHLNPARHYPRIFIDLAQHISDGQLWMLAMSALLYSGVRFVEAYGLWLQKQWAEWFAILTSGMYIPVELFEVIRKTTWPRVTVLSVNVGIVAYLAYILYQSRQESKQVR